MLNKLGGMNGRSDLQLLSRHSETITALRAAQAGWYIRQPLHRAINR